MNQKANKIVRWLLDGAQKKDQLCIDIIEDMISGRSDTIDQWSDLDIDKFMYKLGIPGR